MESLFWILLCVGAALGLSYLLLIAGYCLGWSKTETYPLLPDRSVSISVIVAARNEAETIKTCLQALASQDHPGGMTEVLVVDDHSTDATADIIQAFAEKDLRFRLLRLPNGRAGKKQAIAFAMESAIGELIVTTDADCTMSSGWLSSIASFYKTTGSCMIVGPVAFKDECSVFEKMQSLEFMALIACGGASLFFKKAILCNGANLAFTKKVFDEVGGYEGIDQKASGDDVLLMYKVNGAHPGKVRFLKEESAIVYTRAKETVGEFVQQRKRWASKGFSALNAETKRVSLLVYLFSAWLVLVPLFGGLYFSNSPFCPFFIGICLILIGIKCFIDFLLLFLAASFFQKKGLLLFFIPEQIIYVLYVVLFGLIGSLGKYEWKGRKIN